MAVAWRLLGKILHEYGATDRHCHSMACAEGVENTATERPRVMVSPDFNLPPPTGGKKQSENEPLSRAHWKLLVPKKFEEISSGSFETAGCANQRLSANFWVEPWSLVEIWNHRSHNHPLICNELEGATVQPDLFLMVKTWEVRPICVDLHVSQTSKCWTCSNNFPVSMGRPWYPAVHIANMLPE